VRWVSWIVLGSLGPVLPRPRRTSGAVYLLAHGLVKVILVAALLKNQLWAYPWTIAFLGSSSSTSSTG
jgi:uncharacterized membrane protein